jgi:flagellar basal-body rod protein FlgB
MPISELPILSMLRTKMHWHQERQRLLAENVANADTPQFRPRDLAPPTFHARAPAAIPPPQLARTNSAHIAGPAAGAAAGFEIARRSDYDIRPGGNAVNLEDEMMKVAANQMDHQTVATLYGRSLGLIKTALGKR